MPNEKEQKRQKEKDRLLSKLVTGDMGHLLTRVAFVLNHYPETRNSDLTLQFKYWETFQNDIYKGGSVAQEDMYQLERLTSITRARAKIQNEFKLFVAVGKIRYFRKSREEVEKENQLATKPEVPLLSIYCDQSGKSGAGNYAIVGSVWVLDGMREHQLREHFKKWKDDQGLGTKDEFHFTEMKRQQLDLYKAFFDEFIRNSDALSFKAVAIDRTKVRGRSIDEIIYDLHYQVVHQGVEHEEDHGRAVLPRQVNFWKDKEEGNDALYLTKMEQHLATQFKIFFEDRLHLSIFSPVESYTSILILADLFTGSVARVLNHVKTGEGNQKDQFADYVLSILGLDLTNREKQDQDIAMVYFFE